MTFKLLKLCRHGRMTGYFKIMSRYVDKIRGHLLFWWIDFHIRFHEPDKHLKSWELSDPI